MFPYPQFIAKKSPLDPNDKTAWAMDASPNRTSTKVPKNNENYVINFYNNYGNSQYNSHLNNDLPKNSARNSLTSLLVIFHRFPLFFSLFPILKFSILDFCEIYFIYFSKFVTFLWLSDIFMFNNMPTYKYIYIYIYNYNIS